MQADTSGRQKYNEPMRILQVHNYYQQAGGEDVVFRTEGKLLRDAGHELDAYTVSNDDIGSRWEALKAAVSITWSRAHYTALRRKIRDFRPDVVHVHNFFPLITPSVFDACKDEGVRVVLTLHNYRLICAGAGLLFRDGKICEECVHGSPYRAVVHRCYRNSRLASLAHARLIDHHKQVGTWQTKVDRFIALTSFQRDKMIEAGFPAGRIVVKPNFVEDPLPPGADVDVPRHGALFVGRLSPEKGVEFLIDAWSDIDYPLKIVGGGPLETKLRESAPPNANFMGQVTRGDVFALMLKSRFLVVPSIWHETFGLVMLEAYACGLPVLSSDRGSLKELNELQGAGLTFKAADREDFLEAVKTFMAAGFEGDTHRRTRTVFEAYARQAPKIESVLLFDGTP